MPDLAPKWTRDIVLGLPDDGNRYARFDRFIKRRRFQRAGIQEYWVVDLDARAATAGSRPCSG